MKYQVQENCLTIFLPTELDHHNEEEIRKNADSLIEQHQIKCVIFDFADTNFMDSSGIGLVMGRYRNLLKSGAELHITGAPPQIYKMMKLAGIEKLATLEGR